MSVVLDDYSRDIVTTRNGKCVVIDTRYVPWPLGRGYETQVFQQCPQRTGAVNYKKELDYREYYKSFMARRKGKNTWQRAFRIKDRREPQEIRGRCHVFHLWRTMLQKPFNG